MKKVLITLAGFIILQSCSNNGGESGTVNDGIKPIDSNGGLADTPYVTAQPATDSAKLENRVDLSKRDTFDNNPKK
jgi:hypothetical protein